MFLVIWNFQNVIFGGVTYKLFDAKEAAVTHIKELIKQGATEVKLCKVIPFDIEVHLKTEEDKDLG